MGESVRADIVGVGASRGTADCVVGRVGAPKAAPEAGTVGGNVAGTKGFDAVGVAVAAGVAEVTGPSSGKSHVGVGWIVCPTTRSSNPAQRLLAAKSEKS